MSSKPTPGVTAPAPTSVIPSSGAAGSAFPPTFSPTNWNVSQQSAIHAGMGVANLTAAAQVPYNVTTGVAVAGANYGTIGSGMSFHTPPNNIVFTTSSNKEIVRITDKGEVVWANGIQIDEAAEAFGKALTIGVEQRAGITERVKCAIRDKVFNELIEIAKDKGTLTAEDLTYLLEASKIMEKLKGIK